MAINLKETPLYATPVGQYAVEAAIDAASLVYRVMAPPSTPTFCERQSAVDGQQRGPRLRRPKDREPCSGRTIFQELRTEVNTHPRMSFREVKQLLKEELAQLPPDCPAVARVRQTFPRILPSSVAALGLAALSCKIDRTDGLPPLDLSVPSYVLDTGKYCCIGTIGFLGLVVVGMICLGSHQDNHPVT